MTHTSPTSRRKILSIGGATYDLFVQTNADSLHLNDHTRMIELPLGAKIRVQSVIETCGGGAANTSVGLSRLGCDTSFCGVLGSDQWGERMMQNLRKEGVRLESATVVEGETSSFSVILSVAGDRVILYSTGANAHLHDVTFDKDAAMSADWIYFNHIHEASCVIEDDLLHILHSRQIKGMTWNPGGRQLKASIDDPMNADLLRHCTILLLNKEEAFTFTGKKTVESALQTLCKAGARIACISDGAHGSSASDGRAVYHCPSIKDVKITDTTGAGDAFGVGLTWAFLEGLPLQKQLQAGTINATSVLGTIGAEAGLLTDIEMRKRLQTIHLDVEVRSL